MEKVEVANMEYLLTPKVRGRITGMSHLVLLVNDMDESVRFYRDGLGFTVIRTIGGELLTDSAKRTGTTEAATFNRFYFFEMGNGETIALLEMNQPVKPVPSLFAPNLWGDSSPIGPFAQKVDHLAFDVPSRADLDWYQEHLRSLGIDVSDIIDSGLPGRPFVKSIYMYDPTGNALEIATWDRTDPVWDTFSPESWLEDTSAVSSLLPKSD